MKKYIPVFLKLFYHKIRAILASIIYPFDPNKIKIIGVTGTDGKTSTTFFIDSILRTAGKDVALCNGVVFRIKNIEQKNCTDNTTANPFILRKFIQKVIKENCEYLILEVTSWAISQHRLHGIYFDMALITNITHEHIDLHGSMGNYVNAKSQLFRNLKLTKNKKKTVKTVSIINSDDPKCHSFHSFEADIKLNYGIMNTSNISAKKIVYNDYNTEFLVIYNGESRLLNLGIPGKFNVYNALASIAVASVLNIKWELIEIALKYITIPGRFNYINQGQDFKVIVDFAHTPNSFHSLFSAVREIYPQSKIIGVFGSAGGRDKKKRAMQGEIVSQYLDYSVLTTDDPRYEDPRQIANEIAVGLKKFYKQENIDYIFIEDREKAFEFAFKMANKNDVVLLLSMGNYEYMYVKNGKIKWNDKEKAIEVLEKIT